MKIPLPNPSRRQDGDEAGSPVLTYLVLFMAVLLLLVIGAGAYYIRNLHMDIKSMHKKLGDVESEYEKLQSNAEKSVSDLRRKLESTDKQVKASQEKEQDAPSKAQQATGPAAQPAPAPAPVHYSYKIIQLTEKQQQNGQEVIFTRKSNLDAFFGPDDKMDILSTHLYHVWDDSFLLVIYKK